MRIAQARPILVNRFTEPVDSTVPSHLRLRVEIHVTFGPTSRVANPAGVTRGACAVAAKAEQLSPAEVTA